MKPTLTIIAAASALLANFAPAQTPSLDSAGTTLRYEGGHFTLREGNRTLFELDAIEFNYTDAEQWELVGSGNAEWVLRGRFPARVDFYRKVDDDAPRMAELHVSKIDGGYRFHAEPVWGRQVALRFKDVGDHFFGLTEALQERNQLSPDLRGQNIVVDIDGEAAGIQENYADAASAFFMSSNGYGAFFASYARGVYRFGINGGNSIRHETGKLDWYVFPGHDGATIHRAYYDVIGTPKPVPAWGLGPMGWRDQNDGGAAELVADVEHLTQLHLPFTSWFVDRPYSDGAHEWSQMNFSAKFAEPATWIGRLRREFGLEFLSWTSPATFGDARFAKHLPGQYSYLDLTHAPTVAAFEQELHDKQHVFGVRGHKIDRGDEGFPVAEDWSDKNISAAERRNLYPLLMAKVHDEALRRTYGDDQMTFARAATQGSQRYLSAIWAGDPRTSWDGLRSNVANAMRSAFIGFPVWGSDVGGYQNEGYIPEELYLRWLQLGSVSGLFEIKFDGAGGEGRNRLPWQYDEKFQQRMRNILQDRMQLLPYLYSLARTSGSTGTLMQPLAYRDLADRNTWNLADEFFIGAAILAAPVLEPSADRSGTVKRTLYLPPGNWHDYDQPALQFQGGRKLTLDVPIEKLPRFVSDNSLYVTGHIYSGSDRVWNTFPPQLVIHAIPGKAGTHTSFTYVDMLDANKAKAIELNADKETIRVDAPAMPQMTRVDVFMSHKPASVAQAGKAVEFSYDSNDHIVSVA
ncbi:MAG TPA: TIM-barrel domain-containing protein, partial [Candidatus Acidoferrum sp.]|nr:TIM-barrel domain-containing protein [Candidatus Acidoferrum sp.]